MYNIILNAKNYAKKLVSLLSFISLLLLNSCSDIPKDVLDSVIGDLAKPVLSDYSLSISENTKKGKKIGTIGVRTSGTSDITSFTLTGEGNEAFSIAKNKDITTNTEFNATVKSKYDLKVYAKNSAGKSNTVRFEITITDTNTTKKIGKLVDSAIQGVNYETDTGNIGVTDSEGKFIYDIKDKTISFKIGSLIIAKDFKLSNINSDGTILPVDIVNDKASLPLDRNNTSDTRVIKLLKVLQSLDSDNNPANGILIEDNTKASLHYSANIIDDDISKLKTMVEETEKTFISEQKSKEHYMRTLKAMAIIDQKPFVTVWKTDSNDDNITIPTVTEYTYNYTVDWGDGETDKNVTNSKAHTYSRAGEHTVKISGNFPYIMAKDNEQLLMIAQWGDIAWKNFFNSFEGCSKLDVNATDKPDLSNVKKMSFMFSDATNLIGNKYFNDWDVSNVTNMDYMFDGAIAFTGHNLSNWDVSKVTTHTSFINTDNGSIPPNWR